MSTATEARTLGPYVGVRFTPAEPGIDAPGGFDAIDFYTRTKVVTSPWS